MLNNENSSILDNGKQDYVNGFYRAVFISNAKKLTGIFISVFALFVVCFIAIPSIAGEGNDSAMDAHSQKVVKFAKVEQTDLQDAGEMDVGMLAATANVKDTPNIRKMEDSMTSIDLSIGTGNSVSADNVQVMKPYVEEAPDYMTDDRSVEEFHVYTVCPSNVRGEPQKGDNVITVKARGCKFTVVAENGNWYKIKWGDDGYAYINKSCVSEKKPD